MKKLLALILALSMTLCLFAGCGSSKAPAADAPAAEGGEAVVPAQEGDEPLFVGPVFDDWSEKTDAELYEMAKAEGGVITVYGSSSRLAKIATNFMQDFPGLQAEAYDLDQEEAKDKIRIEAETGNANADVLQCSDTNGALYYEFFPEGYLETYYPKDICDDIYDKDLLKYGMPFYTGLSFWYYNTAAYPDACPVTNVWDFFDKNEAGEQKYQIFCKNIGEETTYLALFCTFIHNADKLAEAYKAKFGTDVEYTYDADALGFEAENAGYEWLYRLSQMQMTFDGDGDNIVEAVHRSSAEEPVLGLASGGKVVNRDENGYNIAWITTVDPYINMLNVNYLYVVKDNDNPAGSRLFIRYMLGGADGTAKGLAMQMKEGNWSVRNGYTYEGNPFGIADSGAIVPDIAAIYEVYPDAQDFWMYWLSKSPFTK